MKANYREMAKELSEIMHEQVCAEIKLYILSFRMYNVQGIGEMYVMLYTKGLFHFFFLLEHKAVMKLCTFIFFCLAPASCFVGKEV